MNVEQPPRPNDDARFDRLVDGELSEVEYRQLLASLDDEPDGWRRCATAFLEAQAWGQELADVRSAARPLDQSSAVGFKSPPSGTLSLLLAMAASFVVALGLGVMLRTWWPAAGPSNTSFVDNQPKDGSGSNHAVSEGPMMAASDHPSARQESPLPAHQPLGHVRLVVDRGDGSDSLPVDVPFFEMDHFDPNWLTDETFSLPPEVFRALGRTGHQVNRNHQLLPIELPDGRRVVFPVEQVEIVPVGIQSYQ